MSDEKVTGNVFNIWVWGVKDVPCLVCEERSSWKLLWDVNKGGRVYSFNCRLCGLKGLYVLLIDESIVCWAIMDGKVKLQIEHYDGKTKVEEKDTYGLDRIQKAVKKTYSDVLDALMWLKYKSDERWIKTAKEKDEIVDVREKLA